MINKEAGEFQALMARVREHDEPPLSQAEQDRLGALFEKGWGNDDDADAAFNYCCELTFHGTARMKMRRRHH